MFSKIVFLLSVGAVLTFTLQVTPEQLRIFFQEIDTQVKALERETIIQIDTNIEPLANYINNAKTGLTANITEAAKPYWATIRALEETAKEKGQIITPCTKVGNAALGTLNDSIIVSTNHVYDVYYNVGNTILNASLSEAYSVIEELLVLEDVVALCDDTTCATTLNKTITQYYSRAKATLIDAETKARSFVNVYLPMILDVFRLDDNLYVSNYTVILNNVTTCINNL